MYNKRKKFVIDKNLSKQFEKYMQKFLNFYQSLAEITLEYIPKSSKKLLIVDIGAGPGLLSVEIHKLLLNTCIIGLDPSINMLILAMNNAIKSGCEECNFILAYAENIPLGSGSVDIVVSRFSLSSWEKPEEGFVEIFRVLKPGGRLILEVLNKDFPRWKLLLTKIHMLLKGAGKNVAEYHIGCYKKSFSINQVEQFLIDAGFKIIEKEGKSYGWKFLIIAEKP